MKWPQLAAGILALACVLGLGRGMCADKESLEATLISAKATYEATAAEALATLIEAVKQKVAEVASKGNLAEVKELQAELDPLVKEGRIPKTAKFQAAVAKYKAVMQKAQSDLSQVYETTVSGYTKLLDIEKAEQVQQEWEGLKRSQSAAKPTAPSPAKPKGQPASDRRILWVARNGIRFESAKGKDWNYYTSAGSTSPEKWVETARNEDFVEIQSPSTNIRIRLHHTFYVWDGISGDNAAVIWKENRDEANRLGEWKQR